MEMVSIQPRMALGVLVLHGAKVCQQLIAFEEPVSQEILTHISGRINKLFGGLSAAQIAARMGTLSPVEKRAAEHTLRMMQAEDGQTGQSFFLEGWHFLIKQPEFSQGARLFNLISLAEQKRLAGLMRPENPAEHGVRVIIGRENKDEAVQECSMVISRYGLPDEPLGTIAVVGPTRMEYERTIAVISYVSSLISMLVTELYGMDTRSRGHEKNN
jgi:heat-inducible transcriptional repressor